MSSVQVIVQKIPILQSCCCGCTLYAGTMIITILDLIVYISIFLSTCVVSAGLQVVQDEMDDGKFENLSTGSKELIKGLYGLFVFFTLWLLAGIIICSMAIHGARTRKPGLLIPWLYTTVLSEVINLILSIVMLAKARDYLDALKELQEELQKELGEDSSVSVGGYSPDQMYTAIIGQAIGLIVQLGLAVYFFLIVYSFYVELKNPPVPPTVYRAGAPRYSPLGNSTVVVPPGANTIHANSPAGAAGFQVDMQAPPPYGKLIIN